MSDYYTYCSGPQYTIHKSVSKATLFNIAKELGEEFGEGYEFEPEKICEGGFEMVNYPNKVPDAYKTIRICWHGKYRYPSVPDDWSSWQDNNTEIVYVAREQEFADYCQQMRSEHKGTEKSLLRLQKLVSKNYKPEVHTTTLKAFHGAPIWTKQELRIILKVFEKHGWCHTKSALQKLRVLDLRTTNEYIGLGKRRLSLV